MSAGRTLPESSLTGPFWPIELMSTFSWRRMSILALLSEETTFCRKLSGYNGDRGKFPAWTIAIVAFGFAVLISPANSTVNANSQHGLPIPTDPPPTMTMFFAEATFARCFAMSAIASARLVVCNSTGSFHELPVAITYHQLSHLGKQTK